MAWSDAARAAALAARRAHGGDKARTARLSAAGYTPKVMAKYSAKWRKRNEEAKRAKSKWEKQLSAKGWSTSTGGKNTAFKTFK